MNTFEWQLLLINHATLLHIVIYNSWQLNRWKKQHLHSHVNNQMEKPSPRVFPYKNGKFLLQVTKSYWNVAYLSILPSAMDKNWDLEQNCKKFLKIVRLFSRWITAFFSWDRLICLSLERFCSSNRFKCEKHGNCQCVFMSFNTCKSTENQHGWM